jgi:hypothetical protein
MKIKGGDKGFSHQPVWADADDWYERQMVSHFHTHTHVFTSHMVAIVHPYKLTFTLPAWHGCAAGFRTTQVRTNHNRAPKVGTVRYKHWFCLDTSAGRPGNVLYIMIITRFQSEDQVCISTRCI